MVMIIPSTVTASVQPRHSAVNGQTRNSFQPRYFVTEKKIFADADGKPKVMIVSTRFFNREAALAWHAVRRNSRVEVNYGFGAVRIR